MRPTETVRESGREASPGMKPEERPGRRKWGKGSCLESKRRRPREGHRPLSTSLSALSAGRKPEAGRCAEKVG